MHLRSLKPITLSNALDARSLATTKTYFSYEIWSYSPPLHQYVNNAGLDVLIKTLMDAEAAAKELLHRGSICMMFAFLCCMFTGEKQRPSLLLKTPYSALSPVCWSCYSRLCVRLYLCVCQTPVLHPLLNLVTQLHTRREKGLSVRVCTTHISSPFILLFFCFAYLAAADWWNKDILNRCFVLWHAKTGCNQWCKLTWNPIFAQCDQMSQLQQDLLFKI